MKILNFLIFLILIIFPFGQLTRLPLGIPEVNIYLQDLIIGGLVILWLLWHSLKKIPFSCPPLIKSILLFVGIATISLLVNSFRLNLREIVIGGFYLLRWIFYAGIYFVIYDILIYDIKWGKKLRWGLVWAGTATAIFGILQYFLYPDLRNLAYLGWDPHRYRVFGTFFDPGFLGMILVLTLILLISFPTTRWGVKIGGFITYVTLALTYSRSSYLAWLAGIEVIAWIKKAPKFFLTALLLGILTIFLLPRPPGSEGVRLEREETVWGRVKNWGQAITIARDNPVFGVGFNTYRYAQKDYGFLEKVTWQESHSGAGADSSLLFVLATTGILGLIAYLWLWKKILSIRDLAILASTGALFIHSWFLNSLFYPWIMLWIWILIASSPTANS